MTAPPLPLKSALLQPRLIAGPPPSPPPLTKLQGLVVGQPTRIPLLVVDRVGILRKIQGQRRPRGGRIRVHPRGGGVGRGDAEVRRDVDRETGEGWSEGGPGRDGFFVGLARFFVFSCPPGNKTRAGITEFREGRGVWPF